MNSPGAFDAGWQRICNWFVKWGHRGRQSRRRSRRDGQPFTGWFAECLECRVLPSNVVVSINSGVVSLAGDAGDHSVNAAVVGGNLELTGAAGTQFTFGNATAATLDIPLSTIGTIQGLDITMQAGIDTISFDATNLGSISGNVTVNLGDGINSLTFNNATVTGNVAVTGGSGNDTIQMTGDSIQALSIITGDDNDTVTLSTVTIDSNQGQEHGHHERWWDRWWDSWWRERKHDAFDMRNDVCTSSENGDDTSLSIMTGNGNDTVTLNAVSGNSSTSNGSRRSGDHAWWGDGDGWSCGGDLWCGGGHSGKSGNAQWQITLGSGTDSVTLSSVHDPQCLSIQGRAGTDTVTVANSTIDGKTNIALQSGADNQIKIASSTLGGKTTLSTGSGDSSSISVNDSTFQSTSKVTMSGTNATLEIENAGVAGPGTTFQGPVIVKLMGPSAVADLGGPSPNNTLTFEEFVGIFGGNPDTTVNVATANTAFDDQLRLHNARRSSV